MGQKLTLEEAISFLKNYVKFSEVKNQKHIDLSLCTAEDRFKATEALMVTRFAVADAQLTEDALKEKLGLE